MKNRKNLLSLISNALIVILTINAALMVILIGVEGNMTSAASFDALKYFTIDSNLFVGIVSGIYLYFNIKKEIKKDYVIPSWVSKLKYVGTTSVMVTFTTVAVFLGFVYGDYFALFKGSNFYLHFLTPVLAGVSYILFDDHSLNKKEVWLGLLPTIIYGTVYFINVLITKTWIDFYFFTFGGHVWVAPISLVVMLSLTYGLGYLMHFLQRETEK